MTKFHRNSQPTHVLASAATLALALVVSGCASSSPKYDGQMGDALQRAKQAQTVLPTPAQRRAPPPAVSSSEVQRAVTSASTGQTATLSQGSGVSSGSSSSSGSSGSSTGLR